MTLKTSRQGIVTDSAAVPAAPAERTAEAEPAGLEADGAAGLPADGGPLPEGAPEPEQAAQLPPGEIAAPAGPVQAPPRTLPRRTPPGAAGD